jgi:hypothetical protein
MIFLLVIGIYGVAGAGGCLACTIISGLEAFGEI